MSSNKEPKDAEFGKKNLPTALGDENLGEDRAYTFCAKNTHKTSRKPIFFNDGQSVGLLIWDFYYYVGLLIELNMIPRLNTDSSLRLTGIW